MSDDLQNDSQNDPHFYRKAQLTLEEPFKVDGFELTADQVIGWLLPFVTSERAKRLQEVVEGRHLDFYTVLENIYDRGNISAVMRTAEAFGFIRFHIIEGDETRFKAANRVTRGADKWVDTQVFKSTKASVEALKSQGVKVYATSLKATKDISEIDFTGPSAIVIGNEKDGISPEMESLADDLFKIDMPGFSQSLNLSVAAALCLFHVHKKKVPVQFSLSPCDRENCTGTFLKKMVLANYLLRTVDKPSQLIARLWSDQNG